MPIRFASRHTIGSAAIVAALGLAVLPATTASGDTRVLRPDLGRASPFAVLGAEAVTSSGSSVLHGEVGLSPGSVTTGFGPDAVVMPSMQAAPEAAAAAQVDLATAYNVTAGLTPTETGVGELAGRSLAPGVYRGDELSLSAGKALTLTGDSEAIWVFQATSTLVTAPGSIVVLAEGASACNVFWQVGNSATLDIDSNLSGTVMAFTSITARTGAQINGRLLTRTGAVTLDTNLITVPTGCEFTGPEITSEDLPENGTVDSPSITVTTSPPQIPSVDPVDVQPQPSLMSETQAASGISNARMQSSSVATIQSGAPSEATAKRAVPTVSTDGPADGPDYIPPTQAEVDAAILIAEAQLAARDRADRQASADARALVEAEAPREAPVAGSSEAPGPPPRNLAQTGASTGVLVPAAGFSILSGIVLMLIFAGRKRPEPLGTSTI